MMKLSEGFLAGFTDENAAKKGIELKIGIADSVSVLLCFAMGYCSIFSGMTPLGPAAYAAVFSAGTDVRNLWLSLPCGGGTRNYQGKDGFVGTCVSGVNGGVHTFYGIFKVRRTHSYPCRYLCGEPVYRTDCFQHNHGILYV